MASTAQKTNEKNLGKTAEAPTAELKPINLADLFKSEFVSVTHQPRDLNLVAVGERSALKDLVDPLQAAITTLGKFEHGKVTITGKDLGKAQALNSFHDGHTKMGAYLGEILKVDILKPDTEAFKAAELTSGEKCLEKLAQLAAVEKEVAKQRQLIKQFEVELDPLSENLKTLKLLKPATKIKEFRSKAENAYQAASDYLDAVESFSKSVSAEVKTIHERFKLYEAPVAKDMSAAAMRETINEPTHFQAQIGNFSAPVTWAEFGKPAPQQREVADQPSAAASKSETPAVEQDKKNVASTTPDNTPPVAPVISPVVPDNTGATAVAKSTATTPDSAPVKDGSAATTTVTPEVKGNGEPSTTVQPATTTATAPASTNTEPAAEASKEIPKTAAAESASATPPLNAPELVTKLTEAVTRAKEFAAAIVMDGPDIVANLKTSLEKIEATKAKGFFGRVREAFEGGFFSAFTSGKLLNAVPKIGTMRLDAEREKLAKRLETSEARVTAASTPKGRRAEITAEIRQQLAGTEFTVERGVPRDVLVAAIPLAKKDSLVKFSTFEDAIAIASKDAERFSAEKRTEDSSIVLTNKETGASMRFVHKRDGRISIFEQKQGEEKEHRVGSAWSDDAEKIALRFLSGKEVRLVKSKFVGERFYIPEENYLK